MSNINDKLLLQTTTLILEGEWHGLRAIAYKAVFEALGSQDQADPEKVTVL